MKQSFIRTTRDKIRQLLPDRFMLTIDFLEYHHRLPRLDPPKTFCEKTMHRMLYERDPRMAVLADKILAKTHVSKLLGPEWVNPNIWSGNVLPPRSERNWPIPYVLKASHGCNWNIFVRSGDDEDWDRIESETEEWLRTTYGQNGREWLYSQIEPRLLVEPYLGDIQTVPNDYKLFVFGGRTQFIQVDLGRSQNHEQYFYDLNWNRKPWEYVCPYTPGDVDPPRSLEKMIRAANLLGEEFRFVRVDLYEIDGDPIFGEFTFYPNRARKEFKPKSVELEIGQMWPTEIVSIERSSRFKVL